MKKLHEMVNIIPVIAKADCLTQSELAQFKAQVWATLILWEPGLGNPCLKHALYALEDPCSQCICLRVRPICMGKKVTHGESLKRSTFGWVIFT